jgi:hypothetical protein
MRSRRAAGDNHADRVELCRPHGQPYCTYSATPIGHRSGEPAHQSTAADIHWLVQAKTRAFIMAAPTAARLRVMTRQAIGTGPVGAGILHGRHARTHQCISTVLP